MNSDFQNNDDQLLSSESAGTEAASTAPENELESRAESTDPQEELCLDPKIVSGGSAEDAVVAADLGNQSDESPTLEGDAPEEEAFPREHAAELHEDEPPADQTEAEVVTLGRPEPTAEIDQAALDAQLRSRLESLIFVSQEPLSVRKLAKILAVEGTKVREQAGQLMEEYQGRGVLLQEVAGGFQFRSNPSNAAVLSHIFKVKPLRLSRSALETLAIVAYRQPLTRAEVEDIRGVDSGGTLKHLFEKNMVRVLGRREGPGRPVIYGTAPGFLELFGLKSLSDLPPLHEFSDLWDEHQELVDRDAPLEEGELPTPLDGPSSGGRSLSDAVSDAPLPPVPNDLPDIDVVPDESTLSPNAPAEAELDMADASAADNSTDNTTDTTDTTDTTPDTAEETDDDPTTR